MASNGPTVSSNSWLRLSCLTCLIGAGPRRVQGRYARPAVAVLERRRDGALRVARDLRAVRGKVRVMASIEDPAVLGAILGQLAARVAVGAAQIRGQGRDYRGRGPALREAGRPDGRGGQDPGLADSAHGV